ncbi:MAG: hypothetical protein HN420_12755, partial [Rhodospirillaceae bacterium]|nr:hypothetical protein [Rhodospirillaceae bacterium]
NEDAPERAGDIAHEMGKVLTVSDSLEEAQRLLSGSDHENVAVVSNRDDMILRGTLTTLDVARAHNDALLNVRAEEHA